MPSPEIHTSASAIKLELWEKIVLQTTRDDREFTFLSRVIDQTAEELIIEYPTATAGGGVLLVGDPVHVSVTRSDAVWAFSSKVLNKILDQPPRMILTVPHRFERIQRRRFVRVDYFCSCKWRVIHPPGSHKDGAAIGEITDGSIQNVSAGGVCLAADEPPKVGSYLVIRPLAGDWPLPGWLPGRIVRRTEQPDEGKYSHLVGVDFREYKDLTKNWPESHQNKLPEDILNLSQVVRHKLMQFVHQRQIELRKKGLL